MIAGGIATARTPEDHDVMPFDGGESHGCGGRQSRRRRTRSLQLLSLQLLSLQLLSPLLLLPWPLVAAVTTATAVDDDRVTRPGPTRATWTIVGESRRPPPHEEVDTGQKTKLYYRGDDVDDDENRENERNVKCAADSDGVTETIVWTDTTQATVENNSEPQDIYYDESVDDNSFISISWTCYLPLMIMALIWIVGPLLCLILCDSEENHELDEIILKNSNCHCAAKYTNRNEQNLNKMFVYQRPIRKYARYWNHFYIDGLLIVTIIDIVCVTSISQSNASNFRCVNFETCKSCASNKICSWSLNLQTCGDKIEKNRNKINGFSNLLLTNSRNCPFLRKKGKPYAVKIPQSSYEYRVDISTNNPDFNKLLRITTKSCLIQANTMNFSYSYQCYMSKLDDMVCKIHNLLSLDAGTYHVNLLINGTYVKYDYDKDHFFTIYDSQPSQKDEQCEPCIFKDGIYRYYMGCRLSDNPPKAFYDRQLINYNRVNITDTNIITEIKCPNVKIISIKPLIGPSAGGTNISITIKNVEKYLNSAVIYKVYIGEYECKSIQPIRNETIACITSPIKERFIGSYNSSVIVHYNDYLVFKSNGVIFKYERSEVTSVTPNWGFVNDSIVLIISGKYLNVDNTVNVTIGDNKLQCNIIENNLECPTSCSYTNINEILNVIIDNTTITDDNSIFYFTCFEKPSLMPNLTLESIVSGNTSLTIIGSHFSSINEMYLTVVDHNKARHNANCVHYNNTVVVCKSPHLHSVHTNVSGTVLNFFITVKLRGVDELVNLDNNFSKFILYPDPEITSFGVENDKIVIINGVDLDRGFEPGDVDLRFTNAVVLCNSIITRTRNSIKCKMNSSSQSVFENVHEIVVRIGNTCINVNKEVSDTTKLTMISHQTEEIFPTVSTKKAAEPLSIEISLLELSAVLLISLCVSFLLLILLFSCNINKLPKVEKLKTDKSVLYMKNINA